MVNHRKSTRVSEPSGHGMGTDRPAAGGLDPDVEDAAAVGGLRGLRLDLAGQVDGLLLEGTEGLVEGGVGGSAGGVASWVVPRAHGVDL